MFLAGIIVYGVFFLMCYLGTGTTKKNMRSFYSYPDEIQAKIQANVELATMIPKKTPYLSSFLSNYVMFSMIFWGIGVILKIDGLWNNLLYFLILGIGLNAFDLFVIDMLWWRNTKRIRFEELDALAEEYKNPRKHIMAFLRGILVFVCVAVTVSVLLNFLK